MATQEAKYNVGMIGVGRKGTGHANGYAHHPLTEIVAAADPDPDNLALFSKRFGVTATYSDYREMLAKENIDIAAPILPVSVNPEIVIGCAEAGVKAIFCEKPAAATLADADAMVQECRSRGIHFAAGDAYRNFHQLWDARKIIESGDLGDIRSINLYQATNEISGGGCQGLSVMRMFAWDADVDWVTGWVSGDSWSDDDQGMGGYVRFVNGIECFIHLQPSSKKGIEIVCSRGVIYTDWFSFYLWKSDGDIEPTRLEELTEVKGLFPDSGIGSRERDADGRMLPGGRQKASIQSIVDSLELGIEPRCSGENMAIVLEIAIALRESARNNHVPVKMPLEDRSLTLYPHEDRWNNKKPILGEEEYSRQIGNFDTPS